MKLQLLVWGVVAWVLPALVAQALGWRGIWGSGSALADFLMPLPVAGGVLHVPSFLVAGFLLALIPAASPRNATRLRYLLLGMATAGLLWLLRLDAIWLAWQTGGSWPAGLWDTNPLGLFLLSDAALALLFTLGGPWGRPWPDAVSALLFVLPVLAPVSMTAKTAPERDAFLPGLSRPGPARGDLVQMVYSGRDTSAPEFRTAALAWVQQQRQLPQYQVDVDDLAVLFTPSLDGARGFDPTGATLTLCLYEDDTPATWLPGSQAAACFSGHVTFQERFSAAYAARPAGEPPDIRHYMARREVCGGVQPLPASGDTGGLELSGPRLCARLEETRAELLVKHPDATAMRQ